MDTPETGRPGTRAPGVEAGGALSATLAARVEDIINAFERQAATVQRDLDAHRDSVEAQAERYLQDARRQADVLVHQRVQRMRELTDELLERAQATRRNFDGLITALERATARLADEDDALAGAAPLAPPRPRSSPPPPVLPPEPPARATGTPAAAARPRRRRAPDAGARDRNQARPDPAHDAARLVAIEMAVAGRSRGEVDRHLRGSFQIADTEGLLDDVFGGDESSAWAT